MPCPSHQARASSCSRSLSSSTCQPRLRKSANSRGCRLQPTPVVVREQHETSNARQGLGATPFFNPLQGIDRTTAPDQRGALGVPKRSSRRCSLLRARAALVSPDAAPPSTPLHRQRHHEVMPRKKRPVLMLVAAERKLQQQTAPEQTENQCSPPTRLPLRGQPCNRSMWSNRITSPAANSSGAKS